MVGTFEFWTTVEIKLAPPRGISTSMTPCIAISSFADSRSVASRETTQSAGSPAPAIASRSTCVSAALECFASEPPRSTIALPVLMPMPAASTVTFGLAS